MLDNLNQESGGQPARAWGSGTSRLWCHQRPGDLSAEFRSPNASRPNSRTGRRESAAGFYFSNTSRPNRQSGRGRISNKFSRLKPFKLKPLSTKRRNSSECLQTKYSTTVSRSRKEKNASRHPSSKGFNPVFPMWKRRTGSHSPMS